MNRLADPARPPRNGSLMGPVAARPSPVPSGPNTPGVGWPGCAFAVPGADGPRLRRRRNPAAGSITPRERGTQPHVPGADRTAPDRAAHRAVEAWMPQPRCWDDMNAASTPEARGSGKNHKSQKFARSTVASGIAGVALDSGLAGRDNLHRSDRALAPAEDQVAAVQQIAVTGDRLLVGDLLVVQVGAAFGD